MAGQFHTKRIISKLNKIITAILAIILLSTGCSSKWLVGDGRGDWTLDIHKKYAITKINSKEIIFIRKYDNPDLPGGTYVIPNYYVTAYQVHEPYIYLEGIQTRTSHITEDEIKANVRSYYLFNTTNEEKIGPFKTHSDLKEQCTSLKLEISDEWLTAQK